jgi:hypothetical protein
MHPRCKDYECPHYQKKYQIVIMDENGNATYGKTFNSWNEIFDAMIELRNTYAKMEIYHHVGYKEV